MIRTASRATTSFWEGLMRFSDKTITRRGLLKTGAATSIALAAPLHFVRGAWAKDYKPIGNFPARTEGSSVNYAFIVPLTGAYRSEEHTSELQSLMRISYAVFCLKQQNTNQQHDTHL